MASRFYIDKQYTLLKGVTELWGVFSVSGTTPALQKWAYPAGAPNGGGVGSYSAASTTGGGTTWPSQYQQGAEGVRSVSRTAAGLWTVTLQDNYQRLLSLSVHASLAGGLSAIVAVHENTTISNMTSAGGSIIGLALLTSTATAGDPASGERVVVHFILQNASEP